VLGGWDYRYQFFFAVDCDSQLDGAKENNRDNHDTPEQSAGNSLAMALRENVRHVFLHMDGQRFHGFTVSKLPSPKRIEKCF
jgi:hypothetical protein